MCSSTYLRAMRLVALRIAALRALERLAARAPAAQPDPAPRRPPLMGNLAKLLKLYTHANSAGVERRTNLVAPKLLDVSQSTIDRLRSRATARGLLC